MDEILESLFPSLAEKGITYDDLTDDEKKTYKEMLSVQEQGQITLEQFQQYTHTLRQSTELELVKMIKTDPKFDGVQARLHCYLLFEAFFDRPKRAQQMLDQFKKRA